MLVAHMRPDRRSESQCMCARINVAGKTAQSEDLYYGGDERLRETVGDCEPDRLERERELLALLSQVVLWVCVSKDAIGLRTNDRCE